MTIVLKEYLGAIAGLGDEEGAEVGSGVIAHGMLHPDPSSGTPYCQNGRDNGCCGPPSIPRLVADHEGTTCEQLTDEQIHHALTEIAACTGEDSCQHASEIIMGSGPFGSGRLAAEQFGAADNPVDAPAASTWMRSRVCLHDSGGSDDGRIYHHHQAHPIMRRDPISRSASPSLR